MKTQVTFDQLKERISKRLSENRVSQGQGELGSVSIALARRATRTFRAHWTGFKIFYPNRTIILHAVLKDGRFWVEGYISPDQPSWILAFRDKPHPTRGSGGPRPDDQTAAPQSVEVNQENRQRWLERGVVTEEELIRMEDFDDPIDAVDGFFNYASLYVLKAVDASWSQLGYLADPSIEWDEQDFSTASLPIDEAIDQGLKKSDIIWLTPDTSPGRPIPCWFVYTRDNRLFVLSGERQQIIPAAERVREVHVVTRWKGRDARLAEFDASVRPITARDPEEFKEVGELLINKRQSARGESDEILSRWMRECVILELIPMV